MRMRNRIRNMRNCIWNSRTNIIVNACAIKNVCIDVVKFNLFAPRADTYRFTYIQYVQNALKDMCNRACYASSFCVICIWFRVATRWSEGGGHKEWGRGAIWVQPPLRCRIHKRSRCAECINICSRRVLEMMMIRNNAKSSGCASLSYGTYDEHWWLCI